MGGPRAGRTTRRQVLVAAGAAVLCPQLARAAHVVRPWPADRPVPVLQAADLDGKPFSLTALHGKPVLLNFWATWCEPCRVEMPSLEQLAARDAKRGLVIVSVNYKEPAATIRHFLETVPFKLPILLDPDGDTAANWTPRVFPSTVLIDRAGVPRGTVVGELDWTGDDARALVEPLLAARKPDNRGY